MCNPSHRKDRMCIYRIDYIIKANSRRSDVKNTRKHNSTMKRPFFTIMEEDTPYKRGVHYVKLSKKYVSLLILLFLTPIVFLFLGYVVSNSPNERPQLIERFECVFELILGIMSELRCGSVSDTISLLENSILILQSCFASI